MGRDDDFDNGAGEDLKKDIRNMFKHSKRAIKQFFRVGSRRNKFGCPPFFPNRNPLLAFLYPKLIVAGIILLTLLFCGVSLYGIIIILLLGVIFILI